MFYKGAKKEDIWNIMELIMAMYEHDKDLIQWMNEIQYNFGKNMMNVVCNAAMWIAVLYANPYYWAIKM